MSQPIVLRKRLIRDEDLELIRRLLQQEGQRGRAHISRRLCRLWDWRQPNGRYREIACRDVLRRLEAKELIQLPPMLCGARRPGYQNKTHCPKNLDTSALAGELRQFRSGLCVQQVQGTPQESDYNGLIGAYHYLGYQQPTGSQLKYLVCWQDRPLACLSFGPAAWKVASRDRFIGWSESLRQRNLGGLVNNDRFLILPWVRIPHLASHLLGRCLRRLPQDWMQVYCQSVVLVETFVERARFAGTAYAAANWICLEATQGRGRNDRFKQAAAPIKTLWVYPLCPDFRRWLLTSES